MTRRNDPYSKQLHAFVMYAQPRMHNVGCQPDDAWLDVSTLEHYGGLGAQVPFISFPLLDDTAKRRFDTQHFTNDPSVRTVRMFAGQLPYTHSEAVLRAVLGGLAGVRIESEVKTITKFNHKRKSRVSTGCTGFDLSRSAAAFARTVITSRVLVDTRGVWFAETDEQAAQLRAYVTRRGHGVGAAPSALPTSMIVLEEAQSTNTLSYTAVPSIWDSA